MTQPCPKIDSRTAKDIIDWLMQRPGFKDVHHDPLSEALVHIFARYCELIIERLNQTPEKNYRAFLNDLGVSRCPPISAQAPLTFTPVKTATAAPIVIPQYTKATAPPGAGENAPTVFETDQALILTQAELHRIVSLDREQDRYSDVSLLTRSDSKTAGVFPFKGLLPLPHEFYIDVGDIPAKSKEGRLQLNFTIERPMPPTPDTLLEWRIESDAESQIIIPDNDATLGLSRSGMIEFNRLPTWEMTKRGGKQGFWLSCRLSGSARSTECAARKRAALSLLTISRIEITVQTSLTDAAVERSFCNATPVDLSKDFFPLGDRPHFGDVLYLECGAFNQQDADVTLDIKLTNPASGKKDPPVPRVNRDGQAVIRWEYWNGLGWGTLECRDTTRDLTEDGVLSFRVPRSAQPTEVNGQKGDWIRARLISGHYGLPERVEYGSQDSGHGIQYRPSTLAPPVIASLSVNSAKTTGPVKPAGVKTHNEFVFVTVDQTETRAFSPFQFSSDSSRFLYFGFKAGSRKMLSGRRLDVYFHIGHAANKLVYRGDDRFPVLNWQYWNGENWKDCQAKDGTDSFNVSGLVSLWIPEDIEVWHEKETSLLAEETSLYWLRVVWVQGEYRCEPSIRKVLLNTTLATQSQTLEYEILGSANGAPHQLYYTSRTPVLGRPILEVREPQRPSEADLIRIFTEQGENALENFKDNQNREENWVRWHEVNDFLESGPSDRHFVVERLGGEIRFGDGLQGMVPPAGANNIRLRCYKTGGGASGNKPAHSIATLRTGIPSVASVTNPEPAEGGLDSEEWNAVRSRGSSMLRHRWRAVTAADYEDLARIASPLVAKARCFPQKDFDSDSGFIDRPGRVSLMIVPNTADTEPVPSFDLLRRVWKFVDGYREPNTTLITLGPAYLRVDIHAVIEPAHDSIHGDIASDCRTRLEAYLHPLTGGGQAKGWAFGEVPHQSDVFSLLESVPGLEYVRSLQIIFDEERPGLRANGNFLIRSGKHRITLT